MTKPDTSTSCEVCGDFKMPHQIYCTPCELQKSKIESIRKQKKRDAVFGNILAEAGVKND